MITLITQQASHSSHPYNEVSEADKVNEGKQEETSGQPKISDNRFLLMPNPSSPVQPSLSAATQLAQDPPAFTPPQTGPEPPH